MNVQITGDQVINKLKKRIAEDANRIAILEITVEMLREQLDTYMSQDEKEEVI